MVSPWHFPPVVEPACINTILRHYAHFWIFWRESFGAHKNRLAARGSRLRLAGSQNSLPRNLIGGRFWSRARQPLLSHERMSRNQQNNMINCNFRQGSCKLITLEPRAYLFFSKSLSFSGLFTKPVRFQERNFNGVTEKYSWEQESVKFGGNILRRTQSRTR